MIPPIAFRSLAADHRAGARRDGSWRERMIKSIVRHIEALSIKLPKGYSPKISVIIPVYDRVVELKQSIESILNQTYDNYEVILVTDGSPQETMQIVNEYSTNPKVRIFRYFDNSGSPVRGRNRGIKEARGEFIAFQDSDDLADPRRLELSISYARKYKVDIVYGDWKILKHSNVLEHYKNIEDGQIVTSPDCSYQDLLKANYLANSTVMAKTSALRKVGGLKADFKYCEDYELWLRLAYRKYKLKHVPYLLATRRIHSSNLEGAYKSNEKAFIRKALEEHKSLPDFKPTIGFVVTDVGISDGTRAILQLANRLIQKGYDVIVFSTNPNSCSQPDWFENLLAEVRFIGEISKFNLDVVFATHRSTAYEVNTLDVTRKLYLIQSDETRFNPDEKHTLENTLEEFERSKHWRVIKWLRAQPLYLKLRKLLIRENTVIEMDLPQPASFEVENTEITAQTAIFQRGKSFSREEEFSDEEIQWIERIKNKKVEVICVLHPEWHGIHASAEQMFEDLLEIPDDLEPQSAFHYAKLLAETRCSTIVISGFPLSYRYLVIALRENFPKIKILIIYHGHYNQYQVDYDRMSYSTMLNLAKSGKVDKLGFVKTGMAEVVAAGIGVKTGFLMNWVQQVPERASLPLEGGPHLGVWLLWSGNWQKPPFTMLASSLLIPGSIVHGSDSDDGMKEYIQLMNIRAEFAGKPLPKRELMDRMSKMHLNMYVTFHECAPMLPLESLSVGAPCLLGPVSHYFEDEDYLRSRLVVPYPDRAEIVAKYAIRAIDERNLIIETYKKYASEYNQQARQRLNEFLEQ